MKKIKMVITRLLSYGRMTDWYQGSQLYILWAMM